MSLLLAALAASIAATMDLRLLDDGDVLHDVTAEIEVQGRSFGLLHHTSSLLCCLGHPEVVQRSSRGRLEVKVTNGVAIWGSNPISEVTCHWQILGNLRNTNRYAISRSKAKQIGLYANGLSFISALYRNLFLFSDRVIFPPGDHIAPSDRIIFAPIVSFSSRPGATVSSAEK